jgi:3-dehydroquinate synthetase
VRLDPSVATDDVLAAMRRDKKAEAGALNMVMIGRPGDIRLRMSPEHGDVVAAIEELRR